MSDNTKYDVLVNGEVVETRSKKSSAEEIANAKHGEDKTLHVQVVTTSGTEVLDLPAQTKGARPWTRTETHDGIEVDVPAGYTVAYTRSRVGAVVARADDKSGWLVITATEATPAENTKVAREITNGLAAKYRDEQAAAKEAADKARAEAKVKRDEERAAAKAAKEAEKEAKRQEREAAKAAKLAEQAAKEDADSEDEVDES